MHANPQSTENDSEMSSNGLGFYLCLVRGGQAEDTVGKESVGKRCDYSELTPVCDEIINQLRHKRVVGRV